MKKIIVSMAVLVFLGAACGDNTASKSATQGDPETGGCQGADCIDAGDGGLDWGAPPDDAEEGEGDDTEASGAPADPCATRPNARQCICARDPDAEECQEEARPLEIASRDDAMECTLDVPCEIKLRARGGSGSYEWSLRQSPEHLHTSLETRNDNKKATVTATPSLAGSYAFTAVLTDTASGESASKEITVRSTGAPVIATYKGQENGRYADATDQDRINLPVYKDLKLAVTTHGSKLKRLRLRDIPCSKRIDVTGGDAVLAGNSDDSCSFIGISLWGRSMNNASVPSERFKDVDGPINAPTGAGESYVSTAYLRAVPSVDGTFVVEAEDEDGKVGTAEIDVGYAPDPCPGLRVENASAIIRLGADVEAEQEVTLRVSGGRGPFAFAEKRVPDQEWQSVRMAFEVGKKCAATTSRTCTAKARAKIRESVSLDDLVAEYKASPPPQTYEVTVFDAVCGKKATAHVSISYTLTDDIVLDADQFESRIKVGSNDTGGRSRLYASFKDRNGVRVAKWLRPINLDDVGGGDTDDPEVIEKSIETVGSGGAPNALDNGKRINLMKFEKVFFRMADPDSGGAMDTRIYRFGVDAGDWCGRARIEGDYFENSCEDEKDGSDAADCQVTFPIRWMTCVKIGSQALSPYRR